MGANPNATLQGPLVAARAATTANPPATSMAATPPETPTLTLSQKWDKQNGGSISRKANSLYFLKDKGDAMLIGEKDIDKPTAVKLAVMKAQGGKEPNISSSLGTEGSAMYVSTQGLSRIFDAAQAADIKSGVQFQTAFDNLAKLADPKAQALFKDPKFKQMIPNFIESAAKKYMELRGL